MEQQIFRKRSLDRISSPEQLNDYMHVTNPPIWMVLIAVILLLAGLLIWSCFAVMESRASGVATVENGAVSVQFTDPTAAERVEMGMNVSIGTVSVPITSLGRDSNGAIVALAQAELPNGVYDCSVTYKFTRVIKLLLN